MKTLTEFFMDTYFMPVLWDHMHDRFFTGTQSSVREFGFTTPEIQDAVLWTTTFSIATKAGGYSVYKIYVAMDCCNIDVICKDASRLDKPMESVSIDYSGAEKIDAACLFIAQVIDRHQAKSQEKLFKDHGNEVWFHRKFDQDLFETLAPLLENDPLSPYGKSFKPQAEWTQDDVPLHVMGRIADELECDNINLKSPAMEVALCVAHYVTNYYKVQTKPLAFYKRKTPGILKHCTTFGALIKHLNSSEKKIRS